MTRLLLAIAALALAGCAAVPAVPMSAAAEAREVLAPTGRLRAGLYLGGPSSALKGADGSLRGVGHDLGRELARQLRVPFEPVLFERNAEVIDAVKAARVDVVFSNATAERRKDIDFSPPYLRIVLDENRGIENHAIGIPKGRERGLPFLRDFVDDALQRGVVRDAVQRAGMRGTL